MAKAFDPHEVLLYSYNLNPKAVQIWTILAIFKPVSPKTSIGKLKHLFPQVAEPVFPATTKNLPFHPI